MITRNDIGQAATGLPLVIVPRLHKLALELLKERDAYREVAINSGCSECLNGGRIWRPQEEVDSEVREIISREANK